MTVPGWVWALTVALLIGLVLFDFYFHVRKAHIPTLREAAVLALTLAIAIPEAAVAKPMTARTY